jgi:hypothetical protein
VLRRTRVALLTLTLLAGLAGPAAARGRHDTASAVAAADCAAKQTAQAQRVQNLEAQAVFVERDLADATGQRYDKYHLSMGPYVASRDGAAVKPAHNGGNHAAAEAFTTDYHYGSYDFFWAMYDSILHQLSDPCSGPDLYAYEFVGRCLKQGSGTPIPTSCNWNVQSALKTKHGVLDDWDAYGGYADWDALNDVACGGQGSWRPITDTFETLIVAWSRSQVRFNAAGGHLSIHRRHTSNYMSAQAYANGGHDIYDAECALVFCDDTGTPSPIEADHTCF